MKNVGRDQLVLDKIFGAQLFIPDCEVLKHEKFGCLATFFRVSGHARESVTLDMIRSRGHDPL